MGTTLTTGALAIAANVPENTIKSWKSRGHFQEGTHFIKSGGRLDWLPAAVDRCRELANRTGEDHDREVDEDLFAQFDKIAAPHATEIARARLAARFEALVAAAEQAELQRVLAAARTDGFDCQLVGCDPLYLVGWAVQPPISAALPFAAGD